MNKKEEIIDYEYANKIITMYIDGKYDNRIDFCEDIKINEATFRKCLRFVKENMPKLHALYDNFVIEQKNNARINFNYINEIINKYIDGNYKSKLNFCETTGISNGTLDNSIKYAKERFPELYSSYENYVAQQKKDKKMAILQKQKAVLQNSAEFNQNAIKKEKEYYEYLYSLLSTNDINSPKPKKIHESMVYKYPEVLEIFNNAYYKTYLIDDPEMIKTAKELINRLNNNERTRDFNLLDYELLSDIPLPLLYSTIKTLDNITIEDYRKIGYLLTQYKILNNNKNANNNVSINLIMKSNYYNNNGELLINDSEKTLIIQFLLNNNIPLSYFKLTMKSYLNKEINLELVYPKEIQNSIRSKIKIKNEEAILKIKENSKRKEYIENITKTISKKVEASEEIDRQIKR